MRKKRNLISGILQVGGLTAFDYSVFGDDIYRAVWFFVSVGLIVWVLPFVLDKFIFTEHYDGTFLIDETDPTDVKFKLTFDTEPEIIAVSKSISIRVDHREGSVSYDGGDDNANV